MAPISQIPEAVAGPHPIWPGHEPGRSGFGSDRRCRGSNAPHHVRSCEENADGNRSRIGSVSAFHFFNIPAIGGVSALSPRPLHGRIVEFFERKGLIALKDEDRREQWYEDWLAYQSEHELYASVLSPKKYSGRGREFDLLRYARFMEVCAYFSPGHAYSLQVTFLGLFSILMGSNEALKKEVVTTFEAGGLFALGVSEKDHGSDLLGNEFAVCATGRDEFVANGTKYYIGNANCASMISILRETRRAHGHSPRQASAVCVIRPATAAGGGLRQGSEDSHAWRAGWIRRRI